MSDISALQSVMADQIVELKAENARLRLKVAGMWRDLEWVGDGSRSHSRSIPGVLWTLDYNTRAMVRTSESDGDGITLTFHGIPTRITSLQAVAQRLENVLSGTGEAECPTNHTWFDIDDATQHAQKWDTPFCPDCGRLLKPEDAQ